MKKTTIFGITAIFILGIIAAGAIAMPFGKDRGKFGGNDAVQKAIEANDYNAFVAAQNGNSGRFGNITESQFTEIVQKHSQMEKMSDAVQKAIVTNDYEAFIAAHNGNFGRFGNVTKSQFNDMVQKYAQMKKMDQVREKMDQALNESDYQAWKGAVNSLDQKPFVAEKILTQDDFNTLVQIYQARNTEKVLSQKLGIESDVPGCGLNNMHSDNVRFGRGRMVSLEN
jgi:hypothetical protein